MTISIVANGGGPVGFGLLLLPFLFSYHMLLISAFRELFTKKKNYTTYVINCLGLMWMSVGLGFLEVMKLL